ncbi:MAG TPA: TetR/AcrR family transcriptional regulator [Parvibaculum sp.]
MQQGYFQEQSAGGGKRERTRSALLDAAVTVVAEKGMEAAKISDITTAAGLANGTFYNHFSDKDEILRIAAYGIGLEVARRLDEDMVGIDDAAERVVTATSRFISIVVKERDWAAILFGSADLLPDTRDDMYKYLRGDLERGVAQGKFDVEVTTFLLDQIGALIAVAVRTQLTVGESPLLTRQICESILRLLGVSRAKARKVS